MALTREQQHVAKKIIRIGRRRKVPRKLIISALATGITESGLRNLKYGDADSQGWRQERAQYYSNPTNLKASINRYYNEAKTDVPGGAGKRNLKHKSISEISQAIQASAFPSRYQENAPQARQIFKRFVGKAGGGGLTIKQRKAAALQGAYVKKGPKKTITIPGKSFEQERQLAALELIQNRFSPTAFLEYAQKKESLKDIPTRTKTIDKSKIAKLTVPERRTLEIKKTKLGKKGKKGKQPKLKGNAIHVGTKVAKMFGLTVTSTTGGSHVAGSYHYQGRAIDISGPPAKMKAARRYLRAHLPQHKLTELFYDGAGYYFKDGQKIKGQIGGHGDHIHLAI